jgi:hypothetical protein
MPVSRQDRAVLRELGRQYAEIAALPDQQRTIALWKAHNGLKPVRPMVTIDQVAWHEMNVNDELTLRTTEPWCREIETHLRRTLYGWRHLRVDMVVEPAADIRKAFSVSGFGFQVAEDVAVSDPRNDVVGHFYHDQLKTEADLAKICTPQVTFDAAANARTEEQAHEIFDGILPVRMRGTGYPMFAPWDQISTWRGVQNILFDLADRPEFMHRVMARLLEAHLGLLDQLEALGLLENWPRVHCTGAHTDELPAAGADPARLRARDVWGFGQAQMFSTVSPAMHDEFELAYAKQWYDRFGLIYYGCCEPLDTKIDVIRRIPRVRKISMSPWVDIERGASQIGRDFVFSRKPNPAFLARDQWAPAGVEADLRATRDACRRHGCPLEFILKDISTVHYEPQRLWQWAEIAMRVATE